MVGAAANRSGCLAPALTCIPTWLAASKTIALKGEPTPAQTA